MEICGAFLNKAIDKALVSPFGVSVLYILPYKIQPIRIQENRRVIDGITPNPVPIVHHAYAALMAGC